MDHSTLSDTEADPQRPVGAPAQDTSPEQERVRRTVVFHDRETMVRSIGQADSALTQIELARREGLLVGISAGAVKSAASRGMATLQQRLRAGGLS